MGVAEVVLGILILMSDPVREVEVVSDAQMWALVVGFLMPLLIAVAQQPHWRSWVRVAFAVVSSLVAGAGTAYFAGEFTGRSLLSCFLIVCVTTIATYQHMWKPSRIAPIIEAKTSPRAEVVVKPQTAPEAVQPPLTE